MSDWRCWERPDPSRSSLGRSNATATFPIADAETSSHYARMLDIRIFKPLDRYTASAELWQGNRLLAEVLVDGGSARRLYVSDEAKKEGIDWASIMDVAPRLTAALDTADAEMRQVRQSSDEG